MKAWEKKRQEEILKTYMGKSHIWKYHLGVLGVCLECNHPIDLYRDYKSKGYELWEIICPECGQHYICKQG